MERVRREDTPFHGNLEVNIAEKNLLKAHQVFDAAYALGIREVVICPGSRSAPLTLAVSVREEFQKSVFHDERGAAFYALGLAKASGRPVGIVTTSGTAVANLFPAVVEATMSGFPLLLLTADRPKGLLDTGANQTIDQRHFFGRYSPVFMDLPADAFEKTSYRQVQNVFKKTASLFADGSGVAHWNIRFEEPLYPSQKFLEESILQKNRSRFLLRSSGLGQPRSLKKKISKLKKQLQNTKDIIFLAGEMTPREAEAAAEVIVESGYPVLADILSNLKNKNGVSLIPLEELTRLRDESSGKTIILHFGGRFIQKQVQEALRGWRVWQITDRPTPFYPAGQPSRVLGLPRERWNEIRNWIPPAKNNKKRTQFLESAKSDRRNTQAWNCETAFEEFLPRIPASWNLIAGNSTPIRILDDMRQAVQATVWANRGASGIDGQLATALGISMGSQKPSLFVSGDISALHDLSSLEILKRHSLPFLYWIVQNGGGAIFQKLERARNLSSFHQYFFTPLSPDFCNIASGFSVPCFLAENRNDFHEILDEVLSQVDSVLGPAVLVTRFQD